MASGTDEGDEQERPLTSLAPSGLGQYISYSGCPRFFRLRFFDQDIVSARNWYNRDNTGNLFSELGLAYEERQLKTLAEQSSRVLGDADSDGDPVSFDEVWAPTVTTPDGEMVDDIETRWRRAIRDHLMDVIEDVAAGDPTDGPVVCFQLPIAGQIGVWDIAGIADLLLLEPLAGEAGVRSRVLEVKTAWKEKTAHQVQATVYSMLLDDVVSDLGLTHEPIATVLNRESDLQRESIEGLSPVDRSSRVAEIRRLLKRDGELHRLSRQSFDDVGYRLDRKCDGCPYNGVCFTKAIESGDPALLNLTQGDQERLADHGIDSLDDLTDLYVRDDDTKPFDYDSVEVVDDETVSTLEGEGTLGNRLPDLVQRAQVLRGELDPTYDRFDDVQYLKGSGNGTLPDDAPAPNLPGEAGDRHELIRVYLHVQHDNVRDRLALVAARVDGDETETREIVEFSDRLPTDRDESREAEATLLEGFFKKLFGAIRGAARDVGNPPDRGFVHLYVYSAHQRDALMGAVSRQPSVFGSSAVRDLLGLREGIEQPMVSVVHNDVTDRLALRYPGTGLVQTVDQMTAFPNEYYGRYAWSDEDWTAKIDGQRRDLTDIFETGLFEGRRPYLEDDHEGSIRLLLGDGTDPEGVDPDGFYPLYNRFSGQIPLEYLWGVRGKLDDVGEAADESSFDAYRFRDEPGGERITEADIEALALRFCAALEHVERSIQYKNWQIDKQRLEIDRLPMFALREADLARACREYLDLEYATDRQECYEHYLDPPRRRVQSGASTIFRVTDVREYGDFDVRVEGELLYDELFENPDHVLDGCRIQGSDDGGSGSWRVMTKLDRHGAQLRHVNATYPRYIENSMTATVERFDRESGRITVDASTFGGFGDERYVTWHRSATTDPAEAADDDYTVLVEPDDLFILDPYADSYPTARAYAALERTASNALYDQLNRAFADGDAKQFRRRVADPAAIETFLDDFEAATDDRPRGRQAEFVREVDHTVSILQGPPGTGKTSYTLAPAVLARLSAASADGGRMVTLVTAPSHTAVDEAMHDVVRRWSTYSTVTSDIKETAFVRVGGNGELGVDEDALWHCNYYDDDDVDRFERRLSPHVTATDDDAPSSHLVVFSTPTSFRGVVDKCAEDLFGLDGAEAVMDAGVSFVDLLAIDEASMIDLPSTLLASAFLRTGAQTLLIGDHRQMEPVQQHDWESEDRRTIEEDVPFMSVLNFARFLRGDLEETDFAFAESPELGSAIPITRLDRTYRLHRRVAQLLTDLVYTDDGIELRSTQTETFEAVAQTTDGVAATMAPDAPVALVLHDEAGSQDVNRTEVTLVKALVDAIHGPTADDVGVVTPHNAQKSRLNDSLGDAVTADTVERFQGGERDVMVVSGTASDPDYIRAEAEFLLDPNRLNVAMSRMKKKLVVVASQSVFGMTPPDADEFDQTLIWKRLYDALGLTENSPATAAWSGDIETFCPDSVSIPRSGEGTGVEVYKLQDQSSSDYE